MWQVWKKKRNLPQEERREDGGSTCSAPAGTRARIWDSVAGESHSSCKTQGGTQYKSANMGSKISLLVYEWPLIKCKLGICMCRFFKICPKLSHIWLRFKKNFFKNQGDFAQNLAQNWTDWYMNGSHFLEKLLFVWVYLQILWQHSYQNQTWVLFWQVSFSML